jgi:hypothetical protein
MDERQRGITGPTGYIRAFGRPRSLRARSTPDSRTMRPEQPAVQEQRQRSDVDARVWPASTSTSSPSIRRLRRLRRTSSGVRKSINSGATFERYRHRDLGRGFRTSTLKRWPTRTARGVLSRLLDGEGDVRARPRRPLLRGRDNTDARSRNGVHVPNGSQLEPEAEPSTSAGRATRTACRPAPATSSPSTSLWCSSRRRASPCTST